MDPDDGRHRKAAVDVGKHLRAPFEILVHDLAVQQRRIDFEQYEIAPPAEDPVDRCQNLVRIGTVDEAFTIERSRRVLPRLRRCARFSFRGDVVKPICCHAF